MITKDICSYNLRIKMNLKITERGKSLTPSAYALNKQARQALLVWGIFFAATLTINLLLPLSFGLDMYDWTNSFVKGLLFVLVDYVGLFLFIPLLLTKGWKTVRKPSFLIPLTLAAISIVLFRAIPYIPTIVIIVFAYLHKRFDLSEIGFRTKGYKRDLIAILLSGSLGLLQALAPSSFLQIAVVPALFAALSRLFGNPASTVENLFYFGFLTERIGKRFSRYLVPFLIGAMYTAHEMSNPEYWYGGLSFPLVYVGVTVFAAVYLWRRSIVVTWLSDGLLRFLSNLL